MTSTVSYSKKEVDCISTVKPSYTEYQTRTSSSSSSITTSELAKGETLPKNSAIQVINNLKNQFSDSKKLFSELSKIKDLQELTLESFSSQQLEGIEKLENVARLILRPKNSHALGYTIPQDIIKMKSLTELTLEEHLFGRGNGRQNMSAICSIPNLKSLSFTRCQLGVFSNEIEKHSTLETASFFGEQISEATIKALQSCAKIKKIEFTNCHFLFTASEKTLKQLFGENVDVSILLKEGKSLAMQMTPKPSPFSIKS